MESATSESAEPDVYLEVTEEEKQMIAEALLASEGDSGDQRPARRNKRGERTCNELLNFTFSERRAAVPPPRVHTRRRGPAYSKERYVQANFRVAVLPSFQERSDGLVPWEAVAAVIDALEPCAVCLERSQAMKVTPCGHVFCHACLLRAACSARGQCTAWVPCAVCGTPLSARASLLRPLLHPAFLARYSTNPNADAEGGVSPADTARGLLDSGGRSDSASLLESAGGRSDSAGGRLDSASLLESARGRSESAKGLSESARGLSESARGLSESARGLSESARGLSAAAPAFEPSGPPRTTLTLVRRWRHALYAAPARQAVPATRPGLRSAACRFARLVSVPAAVLAAHAASDAAALRARLAACPREQGHGYGQEVDYGQEVGTSVGELGQAVRRAEEQAACVFVQMALDQLLEHTPLSDAQPRVDPTRTYGLALEQQPAEQQAEAGQQQDDEGVDPKHPDLVYFYQESSGQLRFIHPLNFRMLKETFGHASRFPASLSQPVLAVARHTMTPSLRKRMRFLSHLPDACEVQVCVLDLKGVVPARVLKKHHAQLQSIIADDPSPPPSPLFSIDDQLDSMPPPSMASAPLSDSSPSSWTDDEPISASPSSSPLVYSSPPTSTYGRSYKDAVLAPKSSAPMGADGWATHIRIVPAKKKKKRRKR